MEDHMAVAGEHNGMRRFAMRALCLACALCLCLTACEGGATPTPRPSATVAHTEPPQENTFPAGLYFADANWGKLVYCITELTLRPGETREEAIVQAMIRGKQELPNVSELSVMDLFLPQVKLKSLIVSNGVALVDLEGMAFFREEDRLIACAALAKALIQNVDSINAVQVLADGVEPGLGERQARLPVGLLYDQGNELQHIWENWSNDSLRLIKAVEEGGAATFRRYAPIFFASSNGSVIPQAMELWINGSDSLETVIDAMRQPDDDSLMLIPVLSDARPIAARVETVEGLGRVAVIEYDVDLRKYWLERSIPQRTAMAALALTVCGILPNLSAVKLIMEGEVLETLQLEDAGTEWYNMGGYFKRADFLMHVGQPRALYYPLRQDISGLQQRVDRVMDQESARDPLEWLHELLRGPAPNELLVVSPFPPQVRQEDIYSVAVAGAQATVDLSQNFSDACKALSQEQLRQVVYCMVNTLTYRSGIRSVLFTVEGQSVRFLGDNRGIWLEEALLRHPGMIRGEN